jgi:hypothetical protein
MEKTGKQAKSAANYPIKPPIRMPFAQSPRSHQKRMVIAGVQVTSTTLAEV